MLGMNEHLGTGGLLKCCIILLNLLTGVSADAYPYSTTYIPAPSSLPQKSEQKQTGTNECGTGSNPQSMCQNLYVNSATDFCLWGPIGPQPQGIGDAERDVVSYCTKSGRGTRLIPSGTLKSVHFVKTPHYVQVSGTGDFRKMFITNNGGGGELDPHGPDELGNPRGGLVFSDAFGKGMMQVHEWNNFMDQNTYCLRACPDGDSAYKYCINIYDELGCDFNMPTNDKDGVFESCEGDDAQIVGVYTENGIVSTFFESQTSLGIQPPPPKPAPAVSKCSRFPSAALGGNLRKPFKSVTLETPLSLGSKSSASNSTFMPWSSSNSSSSSLSLLVSPSSSSSSSTSTPTPTSTPTSTSTSTSTSTGSMPNSSPSQAQATSRLPTETVTSTRSNTLPGLGLGNGSVQQRLVINVIPLFLVIAAMSTAFVL